MAQIRATPRWPGHPQVRAQSGANAPYNPMQGAYRSVPRPQGQTPIIRAAISQSRPITAQQAPHMPGRAVQTAPPPARPSGFRYTANMRNPPQGPGVNGGGVVAVQQAVHIQGQEPLTATMLAAAPPQDQKQMLGERLFPLIQPMHSELAGKITGMLLEIDNSELLHMLEDNESLKAKVEEAIAVLQAHQAKQQVTTQMKE